MSKKIKIVLIGAGNVGFHLGEKLHTQGVQILQVFSRKKSKAKRLGKICNSSFTNSIDEILKNADLYILAIPDAVISSIADQLSKIIPTNKLVVHTSGATPSTILKPYFKNYGIFYPLQTFSVGRKINFENIPICVDANLKKHRIFLENLGKKISNNVQQINDKERAILHVAAVFVNNFSNFMFSVGEEITQKEELNFDILKPLILETVEKIQNNSPKKMQTGPAIRGDENTIERHLKYLHDNFPKLENIYQIITQNINPKIKK